MTAEPSRETAERLASVRARLEATLSDPVSAGSSALVGLETDVAAICTKVTELPAAEAHALAPEMKHVIGLLELLSAALMEKSETASQPTDSAARHRQAAAAYSSGRRRKS